MASESCDAVRLQAAGLDAMNRRRRLLAGCAAAVVLPGCLGGLGFAPPAGGTGALVTGAQRHMGLSAEQTAATLGALFGLARNALSPADFARLGTTLPGLEDLIVRGAAAGGFSPASLASMKSVTDVAARMNVNAPQVNALAAHLTQSLAGGGAYGASGLLSRVWR
jgi:hypothetical protein